MDAIPFGIAHNRAGDESGLGLKGPAAARIFLTQDARGTIKKVAGSSWQLFGAAPDKLRGLKLTDLTAARSHPAVLGAMMQAIREGDAQLTVDLRPTASVQTVDLRLQAAPDGGFIAEIAPEGAMAAELDEPKASDIRPPVDQIADVSHEIRTPLNAVIGFADALRQESFGPLGDRRYRDYAKLIQESGQHVLSLVNDLLDLSKAEADRLKIEAEPIDLRDLLNSCVRMMKLEAEKAELSLNLRMAPGVDIVRLDPKILKQIVLNLLSNALKFTQDGGITLTARILDGRLVLAVQDTGVGMSAHDLERIGERFYQARDRGVRGARGSGLGLALSHALARAHGGRLDLTSSPGHGTTATLTLPLEQPGVRPLRRQGKAEPRVLRLAVPQRARRSA
ncbi:MAG: HAMP domain-containing sensor histidine kinase [Pseudomonadota bacterium]